jgi:glutamine cyclotransferase
MKTHELMMIHGIFFSGGGWAIAARNYNMVMCDGQQVTVDRLAWCEHETHYIYTYK